MKIGYMSTLVLLLGVVSIDMSNGYAKEKDNKLDAKSAAIGAAVSVGLGGAVKIGSQIAEERQVHKAIEETMAFERGPKDVSQIKLWPKRSQREDAIQNLSRHYKVTRSDKNGLERRLTVKELQSSKFRQDALQIDGRNIGQKGVVKLGKSVPGEYHSKAVTKAIKNTKVSRALGKYLAPALFLVAPIAIGTKYVTDNYYMNASSGK